MSSNFKRLVSNEEFYFEIIGIYLNNPTDNKLHNHFVSLVEQVKKFVTMHIKNHSIVTLEMFLKCNLPKLEKYTILIWEYWNARRKYKKEILFKKLSLKSRSSLFFKRW